MDPCIGNRGGSNRQAINASRTAYRARAAQAVLLPLFHAAVAGQQAGVAEGFAHLLVVFLQRPGDAQLAGVGLAGDARRRRR